MQAAPIRSATPADVERLVEVEVEAGQLFLTVDMPLVARDVPDTADLASAVAEDRVWVTTVGAEIAGYVIAEVLDGNAHVAQLSVVPDHAGRALGRAMVEHVEAWGRASGCPATTLTTFVDVPWNAPYYARLGYTVLTGSEIGPDLARTMAHEASLPGIDASLRCAMVKPNQFA